MAQVFDRRHIPGPSTDDGYRGKRPVVLATLSVRIDPNAERMALESAFEAGTRLVIANLLTLPFYPVTMMLARDCLTLPHEEDLEEVRATARRAVELGIDTELLRISSSRPLASLIDLVDERRAGLLVLGPDVSRTSRWKLRQAARCVRRKANCLVWIVPDG
jgi:nucleotide-binding universal stress UspA family protein